ncbi:MAG: DUF3341 domain-containing protein [Planctomycetes bacterium]|nr:DUF3341 domain-containing protein [Planctomycetota bacterium]
MGKHAMPYVLGYFTEPSVFKKACAASHEAGHHAHEAFTPYPIHGLERLMGIKRSWIGRPVLFMLLFGAFCGFCMQVWMMKYDWPINIAGKPYNSWPAYVVITFESGILLGALSNLAIVLLIACRLLPSTTTQLPTDSLTDDTFCLAVPVTEHGSIQALDEWMKQQGADTVSHYVPDGRLSESSEVTHA